MEYILDFWKFGNGKQSGNRTIVRNRRIRWMDYRKYDYRMDFDFGKECNRVDGINSEWA